MIPSKLHWLERAIQTYNFHTSQCKSDNSWNIEKTRLALNRSYGSISQDLLIASWSVTHERELKRLRSYNDAVCFVRRKQKEFKLKEI